LQLSQQFGKEKILRILGTGTKVLAQSELQNYGRTNRSLHYLHALNKGHRLSENDIAVLRTEKVLEPGIHPSYLETVIGSILTQDVSAGAGVLWEHLLTK